MLKYETENTAEFGKRLRNLRLKNGHKTLAKFGDEIFLATGVWISVDSLSAYERGTRSPGNTYFSAICLTLGGDKWRDISAYLMAPGIENMRESVSRITYRQAKPLNEWGMRDLQAMGA